MFEHHKPSSASPKDVFLHLLSILWLYVAIVTFGMLVFRIIDIYFPDRLAYGFGSYASDALKWPLSVLVVVFPLYIGTSYYIQKDVTENPAKRELKIRKWLTYFTLSLAAVVISGDLISLIYTYLNGEITTLFILKVLTVLAIAVSVFVYYTWYLREKTMAIKDPRMRIFVYGVIAVVCAFVIAGFVMAGSPKSARLRQFDDRRVSDLQNIQMQIVSYYQAKQVLPPSLDALRDTISGFASPKDPETLASYEYNITGQLSFELCANFDSDTVSNLPVGGTSGASPNRPVPAYNNYSSGEFWGHVAGRSCFERYIDPQKYPPLTSPTAKPALQ